jgi:hypothetical protein
MRAIFVAAAVAFSLTAGTGLLADDQTTANSATSADDPDRVVCKNIAVTGTRFKKKECHTAREWERMRQEAKEAVEGASQRQVNPSGG